MMNSIRGLCLTAFSLSGAAMPEPPVLRDPDIPLPQRLFDNVFLLLAAGILIMAAIYTGWGLWEILTLPPATLP